MHEGFNFFENDNGQKFLIVESDKLEKQLEFCRKYNIENFYISWYKGFYKDSVDFLEVVTAKRIIVDTFNIKSLNAINTQKGLVFLGINSDPPCSELNFENFIEFEEFRGFWSKNLKNLFSCKSLKKLWLWKYNSKSKDLFELSKLERLQELHIIQSDIKNCRGIEKLINLKILAIAYNRNLENLLVDNHECNLEGIEIEVCKKFDLKTLMGLNKLKTLKIINNGNLKTLAPLLKSLPNLEELQFTECVLSDTNNLYFLEHPTLKKVTFTGNKKYLLTSSEINEALGDCKKRESLINQKKSIN